MERLRNVVRSQFEIYDIRVSYDAVVFFVSCNPATLESKFDAVRTALVPADYIPFVQKRGGEYTITVAKRKPVNKRGILWNISLLAATLVATTITGAILWAGYFNLANWLTLGNILNGIVFFVAPVMLILGTHEMGHYVVAKRFNVSASLPFFLPSLPPLGTLGAFISIRDPFPNRKSLLEIGIAGPIAGFLVTIPVAFLGLILTQMNPVAAAPLSPGESVFSVPYLYDIIISMFTFGTNVNFFPTAFAAWVGFFATALNLLPAGQLDGGHVARALLGEQSKYVGWGTVAAMLILSFEFESWIIIAFLVLILGVRHPPPLNDISRLKVSRKMLGAVALAMFLVSFTPFPITTVPSNTSFNLTSGTGTVMMNSSGVQYFTVTVTNTGNVQESVNITQLRSSYFVATFSPSGSSNQFLGYVLLTVDPGGSAGATVKLAVVQTTAAGSYLVHIHGESSGFSRTLPVNVQYG